MSDMSPTCRDSRKRKMAITAFVLLMAVLAGGIALSGLADTDAAVIGEADLRFEVIDEVKGTCKVLGMVDPEQKGGLVIPDKVTMGGKEYTVVMIGDSAFNWCEGLTSAVIPDTVTAIGTYAFNRCGGLTSLTIPDSVKDIDSYAFQYCTGLTSFIIPAGITKISDSMFAYCWGLTTITVPSGIMEIRNSAFGGCWNLEEIKVASDNPYFLSDRGVLLDMGMTTLVRCPSGFVGTYDIPVTVRNLGSSAFSNCQGLTGVTIPSGITTIPHSAFRTCGLTTVTLPSNLSSIDDYAFSSCWELTTITIPAGVWKIGNSAFNSCQELTTVTLSTDLMTLGDYVFSDCPKLESITIPDKVKSIGKNAFYHCEGLTTVTIPASVEALDEDVFLGCANLTEIKVASDNPYFTSDEGVLLNKGRTVLIEGPGGFTGPYVIPDTVTEILINAFNGCGELTSVTFPNGLTTIRNYAFYNCEKLASVSIPKNVTTIGTDAFNGCKAMLAIDVALDNTNYSSDGRVLFNKDKTTLMRCPGGFTGPYTIPDSVTRVSTNAFYDCGELASVTIPDSVTGIGNWAFGACTGLTTVTIPSSVTTLNPNMFNGCTGLTTVTIPSSVTLIHYEVFNNTAIKVLAIPSTASLSNTVPCPVIWYSGADAATATMNEGKADVLVQLPVGKGIKTAVAGTMPGDSDVGTSVAGGTVTVDIGDNENVYLAMFLMLPYVEITEQPQDQSVTEGLNAGFTVRTAPADASYQWWSKSPGGSWEPMAGKASSTLAVNGVTMGMGGTLYRCVASCDGYESATTREAELAVSERKVVGITEQPADARAEVGSKASFSITAEIVSTGTLRYQWELSTDGVAWTVIDGAVAAKYTTPDTIMDMDGTLYRCVVSCDGADSKTSDFAKLTAFIEPLDDNALLYIAIAAIAAIAAILLAYFFVVRGYTSHRGR